MDIVAICFFIASAILFFVILGIATQIRKQTDILKAILAALQEPEAGDKVTWFNNDLPDDPLYKPRTLSDPPH